VQFLPMANFRTALKQLQQERIRLSAQVEQINNAIEALKGRGTRLKRRISGAAIERIRAGQKARWAKWRKAKKR
jgi:predicted RNase H-like nuclease (RuvC/YqgF family)